MEEHKKCRKAFCDEKAMQHGSFDPAMVRGMDAMHQTTTDWTLCFSCNYWLQQSGKPGLIVNDNGVLKHYNIGKEDAHLKGFDGTRVIITVEDCERNISLFGPKCANTEPIESTNLWSQGTVPEEYVQTMMNAPNKIFVKITWLGR